MEAGARRVPRAAPWSTAQDPHSECLSSRGESLPGGKSLARLPLLPCVHSYASVPRLALNWTPDSITMTGYDVKRLLVLSRLPDLLWCLPHGSRRENPQDSPYHKRGLKLQELARKARVSISALSSVAQCARASCSGGIQVGRFVKALLDPRQVAACLEAGMEIRDHAARHSDRLRPPIPEESGHLRGACLSGRA
jgi:hypothetical protein